MPVPDHVLLGQDRNLPVTGPAQWFRMQGKTLRIKRTAPVDRPDLLFQGHRQPGPGRDPEAFGRIGEQGGGGGGFLQVRA